MTYQIEKRLFVLNILLFEGGRLEFDLINKSLTALVASSSGIGEPLAKKAKRKKKRMLEGEKSRMIKFSLGTRPACMGAVASTAVVAGHDQGFCSPAEFELH